MNRNGTTRLTKKEIAKEFSCILAALTIVGYGSIFIIYLVYNFIILPYINQEGIDVILAIVIITISRIIIYINYDIIKNYEEIRRDII